MIQPPIFFVSGLPLSGNTLLMNLLGQNPKHHVSPANALLDLVASMRDVWSEMPAFRSQGIETVKPRITSTIRGLIEGFYRQEFAEGKIVFDRSRGWLAYAELMEEVLGEPIHIFVMVRDVRAIVAGFEKLYRRNPLTSPRQQNYQQSQTIEGRAAILLAEQAPLGLAIARLRDALRRNLKSKIMLIRYANLCRNPQAVLDQIHDAIGLPAFKYDPNNVRQITPQEDSMPGLITYPVRTKVEPSAQEPWKAILPDDLCERISKDFGDIQKYAGGI